MTEPQATTPQHRAQVRAHEDAVEVIADGLRATGWEASVYDTARAVLGILFTDPDLLREMADTAAPDTADEDERKIECPDCVQWSAYGPDAEEKLIEHWARVHMRRVSWGGDGTAMIWASPADRAPQDSGGTS